MTSLQTKNTKMEQNGAKWSKNNEVILVVHAGPFKTEDYKKPTSNRVDFCPHSINMTVNGLSGSV